MLVPTKRRKEKVAGRGKRAAIKKSVKILSSAGLSLVLEGVNVCVCVCVVGGGVSLFHPGNDCMSPIRRWLNQTLRRLPLRGGKYVNHTLPLTQGNSLKVRMESGREGDRLLMWVARKPGGRKSMRGEREKETEREKNTRLNSNQNAMRRSHQALREY